MLAATLLLTALVPPPASPPAPARVPAPKGAAAKKLTKAKKPAGVRKTAPCSALCVCGCNELKPCTCPPPVAGLPVVLPAARGPLLPPPARPAPRAPLHCPT